LCAPCKPVGPVETPQKIRERLPLLLIRSFSEKQLLFFLRKDLPSQISLPPVAPQVTSWLLLPLHRISFPRLFVRPPPPLIHNGIEPLDRPADTFPPFRGVQSLSHPHPNHTAYGCNKYPSYSGPNRRFFIYGLAAPL